MMGEKGSVSSPLPATTVSRRPPAGNRICVARVGAAHGTRGEVRLWSFTADPSAIGSYGTLETADGALFLEIESLRQAKDFFVARFKDISDRNAAEKLRNVDLYVPRERLRAPAQDEFYHADLIGLAAMDAAGESIGTVVAVHNFGAGDLLEIAPPGGAETMLLPFTAAAVPHIEIAAGRIVVDPPPGLLKGDAPNSSAYPPSRKAKE
jgi:16S rRNA processing protein RimM